MIPTFKAHCRLKHISLKLDGIVTLYDFDMRSVSCIKHLMSIMEKFATFNPSAHLLNTVFIVSGLVLGWVLPIQKSAGPARLSIYPTSAVPVLTLGLFLLFFFL